MPRSQRLTLSTASPSILARSACVRFFDFRSSFNLLMTQF